jgi:5-methylcytosine-specific restriction endonuclease McrA
MKSSCPKKKCSEKHLDRLWSSAVRNIADGRCQYCGGIGYHAHHLVNRWHKSTRWHVANGVYVCAYCHNLMHKYPELSERYFVGKHGQGAWDELRELSNTVFRGNTDEIETNLSRFQR